MRAEYGTAIEQSRVGDSNSNGRVERAVQELKGLTRTLRSAVSAMMQQPVRLADPLVPWMVRHAAHIINVCRVRPDGRTAWQAMKGRRTNSKLLPFAETVLFKIPKTHHRAAKNGSKFKAKHTHECRQRFERLLQDDISGRQRFARAAERRMTGIIKMAMEMQDDIEKQAEAATHARASATAGTISGSGATDAQRQQSVTAQNDR